MDSQHRPDGAARVARHAVAVARCVVAVARPSAAAAPALVCALIGALGAGCDVDVSHVGGAELVLVFNHPPVVEHIIPAPTRLAPGETTALAVAVSDPDGDALTFAWTATCDGTFAPPAAAEPTFTLTAADGDTCTLSLEVRDDHDGVTGASVTLTLGSPVAGSRARP